MQAFSSFYQLFQTEKTKKRKGFLFFNLGRKGYEKTAAFYITDSFTN